MLILESPWFLLTAPFILCIIFFLRKRHFFFRSQQPSVIHSQVTLLSTLAKSHGKGSTLWLSLGITFFSLALSNPLWLNPSKPKIFNGHSVVLALDTSGSMIAQDFVIDDVRKSRLDLVKNLASDFVNLRKNDQIGIVVFADEALPIAPITADSSVLVNFIDTLENSIAGEKTALADAITVGVNQLRKQPPGSKILVLLTDGSNTAGEMQLDEALKFANHFSVKIYPIGVGSHKKVVYPQGPVQTPLFSKIDFDEDTLKNIANQTNGRYFRISNSQDLSQTLRAIDENEPALFESKDLYQSTHVFWFPCLLGLFIFSIFDFKYRATVLS